MHRQINADFQSQQHQHDNQGDQGYQIDQIMKQQQKTLSRMASNLGPNIPTSLIRMLQKDSITHLNLHSNSIESLDLVVDLRLPLHVLDSNLHSYLRSHFIVNTLQAIDLSSNQLGLAHDKGTKTISILSIAPNLLSLNLSANSLTNEQLENIVLGTKTKIKTRNFNSTNNNNDNNSIVIAHNLTTLNLSHNNLHKIPLCLLVKFCPNLTTLNLNDNAIHDLRDLIDLEQQVQLKFECSASLALECLENIHIESNPLCDDASYREKIICFFPKLRQCNGSIINGREREHARSHYLFMRTDGTSPSRNSAEKIRGASSLSSSTTNRQLLTYAKSGHEKKKKMRNDDEPHIHTSPPPQNSIKTGRKVPTKNNNDGSANTMVMMQQRRIQRSVDTVSLHKLNSLENHVRELSKLAIEQVEATNQLVEQSNNNNNNNNNSNNNNDTNNNTHDQTSENESRKVKIVRDANVQTSSINDIYYHETVESPIPPPPPHKDKVTTFMVNRVNYIYLTAALFKWKNFMLEAKFRELSERRRKDNQNENVKNIVEEVIEHIETVKDTKHIKNNEVHQSKAFVDEMQKKDDDILNLKNKVSQLEFRLAEKDLEIHRIHGETTTKLEKIQSESNRANSERDDYYNNKFKEVEAQHKKDREELVRQVEYFERKLFKSARALKQNESKVESHDQVSAQTYSTFRQYFSPHMIHSCIHSYLLDVLTSCASLRYTPRK